MDWLIRNGLVIDGTGGPARRADVAVDDGKIVDVGVVPDAEGAQEIDLGGLALAPGFIDVHTHYDAQLLWDRDLTSSFWHGVTTVVIGNCGFGIAPADPSRRTELIHTLENVEGMSADALATGITWEFESYPEYLDHLVSLPTRINVGAMIGHTPVRLDVLGDDAPHRAATDAEAIRMADIVEAAMAAGALGFATSKSEAHNGAWGRPVASRAAAMTELQQIVDRLAAAGSGVIQASYGPGLLMKEFSDLASRAGRPVTWTALLTGLQSYGADLSGVQELARRSPLEVLDYQASLPGEVWPQIACRPLVTQLNLLAPSTSLKRLSTFKEILAVPRERRAAIYADPDWRARARSQVHDVWRLQWPRVTIQETESRPDLRDIPLDRLAESHGDPFDLMIDVALEDNLTTRFRVVALNDDEDELAELLQDSRAVLGLSDAGAHMSQLYDACFATHLLGHWVREKRALSLEHAVWHLTAHAADVFRIADRGLIRPGYAADLVAFDPRAVGVQPVDRVWDLPGGADRLMAKSTGIEHIWVNGHLARVDGNDVDGARHGVLVQPRAG
jgi:N-acyl-D-aspartate/D-glutamate deacylase